MAKIHSKKNLFKKLANVDNVGLDLTVSWTDLSEWK